MKNLLAQANIDLTSEATLQQLPGSENVNPDQGFSLLIGGIMSTVMIIAALMVLLNMIWGAIEWITSGGDSSKVEKARNKITQSILGIIVLSATTAIFMFVQNFLGICVLNFGDDCGSGASLRTDVRSGELKKGVSPQ